jgi:effector-binding domain-containing protein
MIVRQTVLARPTAVIAASTTWEAYPTVWRSLLDQVWANVRWEGTGPKGRNVMLYHDDVPHVEVGVELDQPASFGAPLVRSELPAGDVVTTVHRGPFGEVGVAHDAIHRWCAEHGVRLAGPRWEVYGHWYEDESRLETEVYWLTV